MEGRGEVLNRFSSNIISEYTSAIRSRIWSKVILATFYDPPIARISHICRGLLYARCWV